MKEPFKFSEKEADDVMMLFNEFIPNRRGIVDRIEYILSSRADVERGEVEWKEEKLHLINTIKRPQSELTQLRAELDRVRGEWVIVDERLPEEKALCLCYTDYGYSFRYWKGNHFEGEHIANEPKVTHWHPLPSPPQIIPSQDNLK